jgi:hypothetical protein
MCDDPASSKTNKSMNIVSHFDMNSDFGIHYMINNLLHNCLIQHVAAGNFGTLHFGLLTLGWFNDKHNKMKGVNLCFTYIYKLSCDTCLTRTNDLLSYYNHCICPELNRQHGRLLKQMTDTYTMHIPCLFC